MSKELMAWQQHYEALKRMAAGEKLSGGMDGEMVPLILFGLVESHEVTKPCKTCGTPRFDYRYERITAAGRLFMEAAEAAMLTAAIEEADHAQG